MDLRFASSNSSDRLLMQLCRPSILLSSYTFTADTSSHITLFFLPFSLSPHHVLFPHSPVPRVRLVTG